LVGKIGGDQIAVGAPLIQTLKAPVPLGIRISPTQTVIALVTDAGSRHGSRLWLAAADGSAPAKIVSDDAGTHPDWTRDGRSLVYINATGAMTTDDDLRLGSLVRRQVINAAGAVEIQTNHEDLAGLLFAAYLGVRCFDDGRILFVAHDLQLPVTKDDMPGKPQIFAWDPRHKGTLTRMIPRTALDQFPDDIQFFDISPDGQNLLIAGGNGAVRVLSLTEGKLTDVQSATDKDVPSFPSWRGDEVCYMATAPNASSHTWEVALWKNGTNRVISADWPAEVRDKFLDK
jgi:dipeptidyl aminopeptidase/acylaminoacyl peptidase